MSFDKKEIEITGPVVGIDLGTTYSAVGIYKDERVEIIANEQGDRITPSFVAFTDEERLVGTPARSQVAINPTNSVYDIKRLIGRDFDEKSVQEDTKHFPFMVKKDKESGKCKIEIVHKKKKKSFFPQEISSMVLAYMKKIAENYLGEEVNHAVITVPAYFNDSQRQATKDAGTIAGLNVLRIINEPTAAALAYGLDNGSKHSKTILVYDLGGGTLDCSILFVEDDFYEVKATSGNTHLGGQDFDLKLVSHFVKEFKKKYGFDITDNKRAMRRLLTACERAKRTLSSSSNTTIEVDALFEGIDFNSKISRTKFETLCSDLFKKTMVPVERCLQDAGMTRDDINDVVLVGGSTRMPMIKKLLKQYFKEKELKESINPDEAVAFGAAVHASVLAGQRDNKTKDMFLLDVCSLSLGIETTGGIMQTLIKRNTPLPARAVETFTTSTDNQHSVTVKVFEGERSRTRDNNLLGTFDLSGITPAPKGIPHIQITYELDTNGILKVIAEDKATGKNKNITISNDGGRLSKDQIDKMIHEAELYKEEDDKFRRDVNARNDLESYIVNSKICMEQAKNNNKLEEKDIAHIIPELDKSMTWLEDHQDEEHTEYEKEQSRLTDICLPIIQKMYDEMPDEDKILPFDPATIGQKFEEEMLRRIAEYGTIDID
uniref:Heat shock protein 70 family protein n=1 Tax=viral metagenome TaxID=1070528 RepID=A0A6C0ACR5_9ZZZZ